MTEPGGGGGVGCKVHNLSYFSECCGIYIYKYNLGKINNMRQLRYMLRVNLMYIIKNICQRWIEPYIHYDKLVYITEFYFDITFLGLLRFDLKLMPIIKTICQGIYIYDMLIFSL